jgi:hypothetical protein
MPRLNRHRITSIQAFGKPSTLRMAKRSARSTVSDANMSDANMSAADPREGDAGGDEVAGDDRRCRQR